MLIIVTNQYRAAVEECHRRDIDPNNAKLVLIVTNISQLDGLRLETDDELITVYKPSPFEGSRLLWSDMLDFVEYIEKESGREVEEHEK